MKPSWLIQTNMDGVDTEPIIKEVTSQGMSVYRTEHHLGRHADYGDLDPDPNQLMMHQPELLSSRNCVLCCGDIDFVRRIYRRASFIPGVWCNFNNMKCSTYYAYLGEHLLNQQYMMMPVGDLLRRWDQSIAWTINSWFIRPDSGAKPFTGFVVSPGEKDKIRAIVQSVGPETLVIIAPEKSITREWRFVICDKKVVTGCQYLPIEESYTVMPPPSSFRLACKIADHDWQPDICYTVDIAESEGEVYLLEINSFSCAGFYQCNICDIVSSASEAAIKEWKDYRPS